MTVEWSDVSFTLGGEPFPVENVSFTEKVKAFEHTMSRTLSDVHASVTISLAAFEKVLSALFPPAHGASMATLCRRVSYGGRKGRSALRRIYAQGYGGIVWTVAGPMLLPRRAAGVLP